MIIIILSIFIFFNAVVLKSDTLEIKKDIYINDQIEPTKRIINNITDLNKSLDGYLVFEISNFPQDKDTNYYSSKIFYVDSLSKYGSNFRNGILLNVGNEIIMQSHFFDATNDSIYNVIRLVWQCFRVFNKDKPKDCLPFLFNRTNGFKTNIFEGNSLVEKDFKKYFIYRIKLNALIYEFYTKENATLKQVFIPISELNYFSPVSLEHLEMFNFKKSSEVVRFH